MRILVHLIPLFSLGSAAKQCFFPSGRLAEKDFPCDPSLDESPCCGEEAVCLTNKLCRTPEGNLIRGTCTDKNWNSPQCAQFCLSLQDGGEDLISCTNVTGPSSPEYCCLSGPAGCCDTGVARFAVLPANPQPWAKWDASASSVVILTQQQTSPASSSSSPSSTSSSPTSSTATTTNTSGTPSSTATPPTSPTTGETTNPPSSSSTGSGLPVAAQAGIGVGVAVVVLLLAALGFLLRKLRQNRRELQAQRERVEAMVMAAGQGPNPAVVVVGQPGAKYILDGTTRAEMDGGSGYESYGYGELPATPAPGPHLR